MNRMVRILLLCWMLMGMRAEGANHAFEQMPADVDQVDVYLHTIDLGNLIFNNFGHVALRVHDKVSGRDVVYNWGMFDFKDPISFGLRFYRGILHYALGVYPNRWVMENYRREQRKVWEDKLDLTREQKIKLFERLIWNVKPENVYYQYEYFFDNCSTRIREYLDEALGGTIKASNQDKHTPQTFRDMVYEGYAYTPGMDLFLDIAMNSNLDRLMTTWDRMFHPIYMRDVYLQSQNNGKPLVSESRVLFEFPRPDNYPGLSFMLVLLVFGVPLSLLGVAFFIGERRKKTPAFVYRLFALISLPLLGFGALLGFLMPLTWVVSQHRDLHHNANMLLFWPLDAVLLVWAFAILVQGQGWRLSVKRATLLKRYVLAHMIGTLLMPVLRLLGIIHQDVDRMSVWVLPPYMVILFLLWRMGTDPRADRTA